MKLTSKARNRLPAGDFALPGGRYPINDPNHARNALARVSQFGTEEEKQQVRKKVRSKYPEIGGPKLGQGKKKSSAVVGRKRAQKRG
jgi:hypothetical protein